MKIIKKMFRVVTGYGGSIDDLAAERLDKARLALLEAHEWAEHYNGIVSVLESRIKRLETRTKTQLVWPDIQPQVNVRTES